MTRERKDELIAQAAKVLTSSELEEYRDTINNIEIISRRNAERLAGKYNIKNNKHTWKTIGQ